MRMSRIVSILFIGVLLILPNCAKSVAPVEKQPSNEVWVPGREFRPSIITVPVGTTVTWISKGGEQHTVTSGTGLFNGTILPFGSFSYTFTERGRFEYYCNDRFAMTGAVIVE